MNTRTLPIAVVARETGISRDLLRKWESRYGFPVPVRSGTGIRGYTIEQVDALREIKRQLDAGIRPSLAIRSCWQDNLLTWTPPQPAIAALPEAVDDCMSAIKAHDVAALYSLLDRRVASMGVRMFIPQIAAPLTVAVGEAWMRGELRVHEEHMFSATLSNLLSELQRRLQVPHGRPRILLTTPPGELHALGIEMVRVLLSEAGAACIYLGVQTPLAEMAAAAAAYDAQVVALSFSAAYPARLVGPTLVELRALLPEGLPIWVGGSGAQCGANMPVNVRAFVAATDVIDAVRELDGKRRIS